MARKKTPDAEATPPDALKPDPPAAGPPAQRNGAREPDIRWSVRSDRSTRVDVECFVNRYAGQDGEEYEQVSTVLTRSFLGQDGTWVRHGGWRTHDIPVLLFLLAKAHAFALERRIEDSSMPF